MFKLILTALTFGFGTLVGTHMTHVEGPLHTRVLTSIQLSIDDIVNFAQSNSVEDLKTVMTSPMQALPPQSS